MPKKQLFPGVNRPTKIERINLYEYNLINEDGSVVSWMRLAPWLVERALPLLEAKQLVLIELERLPEQPRMDTITRLVSYISYYTKEETLEAVDALIAKY